MEMNLDMSMFVGVTATLLLASTLSRLVYLDMKTGRLPDIYTLPLMLFGLALNASRQDGLPTLNIWGAIIGYLAFWAIGVTYHRLRGIDGLGLGDAKLLAAAGAWLGVGALPILVLISACSALAFAFLSGLAARDRFPFGPSLAAAFFILWVLPLVS